MYIYIHIHIHIYIYTPLQLDFQIVGSKCLWVCPEVAWACPKILRSKPLFTGSPHVTPIFHGQIPVFEA